MEYYLKNGLPISLGEKIASGGELMYSDLFLHFGNGKNKAVFAEH